ncbi:MAG: CinA family nicotinamide mononucleotide deamidase-related protein, partial [Bacteroidetes bacterium]|nr:CinA family nicotinamide mononucleotide deamidase-related protein [Bacteroidota bacterium]
WIKRRVAVGDVWNDIGQALDEESKHSQIILITGGLGPTADDITKPLLCEYFGGKLIVNEEVLAHVKYLFENVYRRPGPMLERNLKQAEVPDVCTVLPNTIGTAPGMWFEKEGKIFVSMPGVPIEMKGLLINEVIPLLKTRFQLPLIIHKTAFTFGMGESMIAERIKDFESALPPHIKLAYLPGFGLVKLRLTMVTDNKETGEKEIEPLFTKLKQLVNDVLVSDEDEGLEVAIGKLLLKQNKSMATAESCTGGNIAHLITTVPGSSQYFKGTVVSYANEAKENVLHVNHDTLTRAGAVSEETVREMVAGVLKTMNTDYALATSGIMGPDGGSEEKPVGTIWIAAGNNQKTETLKLNLRFDRIRNIEQASLTALNFLRKFIINNG